MNLRFLACGALLAIACPSQASLVYGSNLVVNGDAEAGMSGWNAYAGYSLFQSVDYGSNWVLPTQPGPHERGTRLFSGLGQYAVGMQTLDFGTATAQRTAYSLSGWLGGWAEQGDNALFHVQFLDAWDQELGSAAIGPVMPRDRGGQTGLVYRALDGYMPAGTSKLSFWLSMERLASSDNDGYADNLSFTLRAPAGKVPEPAGLAAFVPGLAMLAWARRRRSPWRRG